MMMMMDGEIATWRLDKMPARELLNLSPGPPIHLTRWGHAEGLLLPELLCSGTFGSALADISG